MMESFARHLPKIELHAHLSGSISRDTLHSIWEERKETQPDLALEDPIIALPAGKVDYDLKTFFPLFNDYIYKLCSNIPSIRASTLAVLAEFEADNVVYLELRTTPRTIPIHTISKRLYVETVLSCIEEFEKLPLCRMKTRLILSIDRRNSLEEALETVNLAIELQSRGIVAIDLCGNPIVGPIQHLAPAFAKAKPAGLKMTLHFAESPESSSEQELQTLLSWKPDRLGHVIHVNDALKQEIIDKNIGVELCLSCNVHAKMITGSFDKHHFGWWKQHHAQVALCTDDVGVFGSPLSNEYQLAAQFFCMQYSDLKLLSVGVADMIFGSEDDKARLKAIFAEWQAP